MSHNVHQQQFEFTTTFVEADFKIITSTFFGNAGVNYEHQPEFLIKNSAYAEMLHHYASNGWELISVQPLIAAFGSGDAGLSYTRGYYFFWKRPLM